MKVFIFVVYVSLLEGHLESLKSNFFHFTEAKRILITYGISKRAGTSNLYLVFPLLHFLYNLTSNQRFTVLLLNVSYMYNVSFLTRLPVIWRQEPHFIILLNHVECLTWYSAVHIIGLTEVE